ncbi:DEAD/DEAH box helicase family protein [Clostridium sp.]|uniref:DEAD/DEAH box helicase n=1 Tax=Clostridium sp. TaxID=1506 RepID=UPI001A3A6BE4|nr:DEAD/DEAH box helicase family protein [Clostridium sp.]MBK5239756.1 DEAD/DEAH box helicase family protein [Clostridium sp.]
MLKLKEFQSECVKELKNRTLYKPQNKIIIKSPTGSGKTIILTKYMDEFLDETKEDICFIWLTPGAGNLETQSKEKFDENIKGRKTKVLQDILTSGFEKNNICFINWEQVTKKDNKALRETEVKNLFTRILEAKLKNIKFILIVDECHKNITPKAIELMDKFECMSKIMVSATVSKADIVIPEADVIASELITRAIYINEGVSNDITVKDEYEYLIEKSINKQIEIRNEYKKLNKNINPLIIIQYPNASNDLIDRVDKYLESKGYNYNNKTVSKWLSEAKDKINIDSITKLDDSVIFLHMKQAISTGWDCTRAKVLVKLRENMKDDFEIQTIGRIRRMPEQKHYNNETLDNCYLYTFDEDYKNEVLKNFESNEIRLVYIKDEYKEINVGLLKELKSEDKDGLGEREIAKLITKYYKQKYSLDSNRDKNITLLEINGYSFDKDIKISMGSGKVSTTEAIESIDKVTIKKEVDLQDTKLQNAIWIISQKVSLDYSITHSILKRLFLGKNYKKKKIKNGMFLKLNSHEFYAYVVNNRGLIKYDFLEAISQKKSQKELTKIKGIKTIPFSIPERDIVKYDPSKDSYIVKSNVYKDYTSDIIRSKPEKRFEKYCEGSSNIEWLYKNGEKSQAYLSIIYVDSREKQWGFYPDYVIKENGQIWIIEVKGGATADGTSKNIDKLKSENKFEALKRYVEEHNINPQNANNQIKWAFVRDNETVDDVGDMTHELLYSNTDWVEDISNIAWKKLKDIL